MRKNTGIKMKTKQQLSVGKKNKLLLCMCALRIILQIRVTMQLTAMTRRSLQRWTKPSHANNFTDCSDVVLFNTQHTVIDISYSPQITYQLMKKSTANQ